jgi:hypothetical protein
MMSQCEYVQSGQNFTKMKKFHPAATPKLSSTNLPAKRINGEVIGK